MYLQEILFSQKQIFQLYPVFKNNLFTLADDDIFMPGEKFKIILLIICKMLIKPALSSSYTLLHLVISSDSVYSVTVV